MSTTIKNLKLAPLFMLVVCACLLVVSGCVRYAHNVNTFYDTSTSVTGGSGDVHIVIPENLQSRSPDIKWVLGKVKDDDNNIIDEVYSPRSPAEIIQAAFGREFKRAGYNVILTSKRPADAQRVIDLTTTVIDLEQISDVVDLKAKCRVLVGLEVSRNGQQIKRFQYESTTSRTDIKDRDLLARNVLEDALQSLVLKAMPDLNGLIRQ
jgi:hypothetical protein